MLLPAGPRLLLAVHPSASNSATGWHCALWMYYCFYPTHCMRGVIPNCWSNNPAARWRRWW